ncbi:MAG TPA: DUF3127 domain-containing protein [Bacteroidetes bacterium]|nr:DUF3127 domain-containing protein [Bacteroidota bacterium]
MTFEITGKLIEKYDIKQVSDKFRKREFVLEKKAEASGLDFSDYIKFQLTQDRCDLIDPYNINDVIKVYFNIRGNKWEKDGNTSYFTNLDVWKIETVGTENEDIPMPDIDNMPPPAPDEGETDDLPF